MINQTYDAAIIGGGLIGLMTARELSLAGYKVAIFESRTPGSECSWAGGGILSPLYPWRESEVLNSLASLSNQLYPALVRELREKTGIDPEWQQCGMLSLGVEDREKAAIWGESNNFPIKVIEAANFETVPGIRIRNTDNTLWLPAVAQIRNPRLLSALKVDLIQLGVDIFEHTKVSRIRSSRHKVQAIETAKGDFSMAITVVACGAWGSGLLPDIDVRPVRGQMLCYKGPAGHLKFIVLKSGIYLIPRQDGHILVGSTVEDAGFDKSTTEAAKLLLSGAAEALLPEIIQFPLVGHWSGLRPATSVNLPYICAYPGVQGLYLNTGHHRNGILLAPGSARLLADIISGQPSVLPASPFQFTVEGMLTV